MQKYKGIIEYDGSKYFGMQKQIGRPTIQNAIENALSKFTGEVSKTIDYCGRTDAGVHAFGQVIHFEAPQKPIEQVLKGINYFLNTQNEEISIKHIAEVTLNFHSRFSCIGREYKYYIYNHPVRSPIFNKKMHHISQNINIASMNKTKQFLIGKHDFSSFRGKACQALSPIKTVDFINISQPLENIIEIHIGAKSFLYKMVRNITGALIYAGINRIKPEEIPNILAQKDINALPYTAPAHGLYFCKALY
ncbi:MAG: tRNA pseudouridine38-40 synthase [Candidatus Deianiraeaceae bacterium]|jgi:tRNA pseudouridine38-40 synthase